MLALVWRVSRPHVAVLGRIPGTTQFGDRRAPRRERARSPASGSFGSKASSSTPTSRRSRIGCWRTSTAAEPAVRLVVLDLANTPSLDLAGVDLLVDLSDQLGERGVTVRLAETTGPVRDVLRKEKAVDKLGALDREATVEQVIEEWQAGLVTAGDANDER